MIGLLEGTLITSPENPVIVKTGGVGFAVHIPPALLSSVKNDSPVTFYTHLHVTDDDLVLFGFPDRKALSLFRLLLSVSGIGPKTALLVVDKGTAAVENAITRADADFFTGIPRLGKKNAQKIIIELKPKLSGRDTDISQLTREPDTAFVVDALRQMGFTNQEIREAIGKTTQTGTSPAEKIKAALKYLSK